MTTGEELLCGVTGLQVRTDSRAGAPAVLTGDAVAGLAAQIDAALAAAHRAGQLVMQVRCAKRLDELARACFRDGRLIDAEAAEDARQAVLAWEATTP